MLRTVKNQYHFLMAWLGSLLYGHPSRKLFVIGITGTKGKSTAIALASAILEAGGLRTAALSTVSKKIGESTTLNRKPNTMPGRFAIQRFLRQAVREGCSHALIEVTSQGVVQHRHKFIDFDGAAFTCLHPEHIEAHGSFENYREAKVEFFRSVAKGKRKKEKVFFLNANDPASPYFEAAVRDHKQGTAKVIYFSKAEFLEKKLEGNQAALGPWLESDFNLENAALAVTIGECQGVGWAVSEKALKDFKGVPGRLEYVYGKTNDGRELTAVIDYAHTPGSLEAVYSFLKKKIEKTPGRLICVLGAAGGGRDRWKRPEMGKIAEEYCDKIFLTSEDPYDESPEQIIHEITEGMTLSQDVSIIVDRQAAIKAALEIAQSGDMVVITGMGSQSFFYTGQGKKIPWSERKIVDEYFKK